jgi:hypothetical protein
VNDHICKPLDPPELLRQLRVPLALTEIEGNRASAAAKAESRNKKSRVSDCPREECGGRTIATSNGRNAEESRATSP